MCKQASERDNYVGYVSDSIVSFAFGLYGLGSHGSAFQTENCPRSLHLHVIQGPV